jgi:Tfp pilus assembly protein PilV
MKAELFGNHIHVDRGSSTIEILIAFAVFTLSITAVISLFFGNQNIALDTQLNDEALYKAQALLEKARIDGQEDFYGLTNFSQSDSIYNKTITYSDVDADTKKAVSNVSWSVGGKNLFITLSSLLTNAVVIASGDTCNPTLAGNWKSPVNQTWEFGKDLVVPNDTSSGYPITDVKAFGRKLYVTVNNTHGNNNGTFFAFTIDTSNPTKPAFIYGIDNDPDAGSSEGLNAIAIGGRYAYVANARQIDFSHACSSGLCGQLQVIDLSGTPAQVIKTFQIPSVTGKNGQSIGKSVFYKSGIVYLGLAKTPDVTSADTEFNIIDVGGGGHGGTPQNPVFIGGYQVGAAVNAIYVKDGYAYLAIPDSGNDAEDVTVIDVSTDAKRVSPARFAGYNGAGGSNGESLQVLNDKIYLGRTYGTNEFYKLNAPSATYITSIDVGSGNGTTINGLQIRDHLAFFLTGDQFQVWDLNTNQPWTPSAVTSEFLNIPVGSGTSLSCTGNSLYAGSLPSNDKGYITVISPGLELPTIALAVHDSAHSPVAIANYGANLHAAATLSGTQGDPTGTVSFTFYTNGACSAGSSAAGSAALASSVADPSTTENALTPGTYSFKAHYGGDAKYVAADSSCGAVTVNKLDPTVTTEIHNAAHTSVTTVVAGLSVHDKATVTGTGPTPTGTVSFQRYSDATCTTVNGAPGVIALGSGTAESASVSATSPGLSYKATYSGDANYNTAIGACEPLTVTKASPSISTTPGAGGTTGITLTDTATVSGGYSPTGAVTFKLYSPSDPTCSAAAAYTVTDNTAPYAAPGFVSNAVGVWHWKADYAGDSNNNSASSGCGEPVTTTAPAFDYSLSVSKPSITMNQGTSNTNTITVTMIPFATAQPVSMTFSNLQNSVTVSPASSPGNTCTPLGGTCSITFTITAASNAQKKTNTITVTGVSPPRATTFSLKIQ